MPLLTCRACGRSRARPAIGLRGEALILWAMAFFLSLVFRPLFPVDETRYVSVAWEMWVRGDFLVPRLNGETYAHKPPLLFWLMHAGWWLFGVNEWWARLVPASFALGNLYLCGVLARRLWPSRPSLGPLAASILMSSLLYFVFAGLVMFDMLVAFFTLSGVLGVLWAGQEGGWRAWLLTGTSLGLGILAKGPVILLHILPVALLAPLWRRPESPPRWGRWYASLFGAAFLGSAIALSWALAAAHAGGDAYAREILWSQTADRVVESFAHRRPWWWYLPVLPLAWLPWSLHPALIRSAFRPRAWIGDSGNRFVLAWIVPPFVLLSFVSGKQTHYLMPLFAGMALLAANWFDHDEQEGHTGAWLMPGMILCVAGILALSPHYLSFSDNNLRTLARLSLWPGAVLLLAGLLALAFRQRWWPGPRGAAAAMAIAFAVLYVGVLRHIAGAYDMAPMARQLRMLEMAGVPVAHVGKYYGEFHFLGRLTRPLERIEPGEVESWLETHPDGRVVALASMWTPADGRRPEFRQSYRSNTISIWAGGMNREQ